MAIRRRVAGALAPVQVMHRSGGIMVRSGVVRRINGAWTLDGWVGSPIGSYNNLQEPQPASRLLYTSGSTVLHVRGGNGNYTYAWSQLSGMGVVHPEFPNSPTTRFYADLDKNNFRTAYMRCNITSAGHSLALDYYCEFTYFTHQ